jgi:hypothetical protein
MSQQAKYELWIGQSVIDIIRDHLFVAVVVALIALSLIVILVILLRRRRKLQKTHTDFLSSQTGFYDLSPVPPEPELKPGTPSTLAGGVPLPPPPSEEEKADTTLTVDESETQIGAAREAAETPVTGHGAALARRKARKKREEPVQPQAPTQRDAAKNRTQPPRFTAYYPEAVKPSSSYALMAFVHLESARAQVEEIAQGYAAMMGGSQATTGVTSAIKVDVGSLITFMPVIAGITFDAAERVVTWQPPYQSATFLFTTPADLPPNLTGQVVVYQGPLIIGEIPVKMQVVAADQPVESLPNKSGEMQRLQPVFASYSHRDTPVMEFFRRNYARLGQKMLVDVYDLRSGEHWADRLLEMIGESAVFQLFWSRHSAQSNHCRQEWESALGYLDERPRFIRPVWWQEPMPTPPPELADLHFQRVPLPVLTRMQMLIAKIQTVLRQ